MVLDAPGNKNGGQLKVPLWPTIGWDKVETAGGCSRKDVHNRDGHVDLAGSKSSGGTRLMVLDAPGNKMGVRSRYRWGPPSDGARVWTAGGCSRKEGQEGITEAGGIK
jgi:hypothetical protein